MLELGFFSEFSFRIICEIIGSFIYSLFVDDIGEGKNGIFCLLSMLSFLFLFFFVWIPIWSFLTPHNYTKRKKVSKNLKKLTRKQRKQRKN